MHHLEPFTAGSQRMVSTAFCILFRAFTMRLTTKQIRSMLKHPYAAAAACEGARGRVGGVSVSLSCL